MIISYEYLMLQVITDQLIIRNLNFTFYQNTPKKEFIVT